MNYDLLFTFGHLGFSFHSQETDQLVKNSGECFMRKWVRGKIKVKYLESYQ